MPRKTERPKLPKVPCSGTGCERFVRQTRPSKSGLHWCDSLECSREKARFYADQRAQRAAGRVAEDVMTEHRNLVAFISAAVHDPRIPCPLCGLENALKGFPHRGESGAPCRALGESQVGIGPDHIDAIWPERRPEA